MTRLLKPLSIAIALASPFSLQAETQTPTSPRTIISQARAEMDSLIQERRMGDAIRLFEGLGVPADIDLDLLDAEIREIYPEDFENVAMVRAEVHKNGFRQEMIAYWTGRQYLYVYLLIHTDNNQPRLLEFQFDSSFNVIHRHF